MNNYKRLGLLLALSVLGAIPVMAQSINPSTTSVQNTVNLPLSAKVNRNHLLTPSAPIYQDTIDIRSVAIANLLNLT